MISSNSRYLSTKATTLDEVVIYNIDIKKKLQFVLDNYTDLYSTKKIVNHYTYKENLEVNDTLTRIFQTQLKWWSKNSLFHSGKTSKENKISIESVDYSRIKGSDEDNSKGGYIDNATIIRFMHLDFILKYILLKLNHDFDIKNVNRNKKTTTLFFDAPYYVENKQIYDFVNSSLVFDNNTGAILNLNLNMDYTKDFEKKFSKRKKNTMKLKQKTTECSYLLLK